MLGLCCCMFGAMFGAMALFGAMPGGMPGAHSPPIAACVPGRRPVGGCKPPLPPYDGGIGGGISGGIGGGRGGAAGGNGGGGGGGGCIPAWWYCAPMAGPPQPYPNPGGKGDVAPKCEAEASFGGSGALLNGRPVDGWRATPGKECGGPQPAPQKGGSGGWPGAGMPWWYARLGSGWGGRGGEASFVGLNLGAWLGGLLAGGLENLGGLLEGGGGLKPVASGASGLKEGAPTRNEGISQMLSPRGVINGGVTRPAAAGAAAGGMAGGTADGIAGGSSGLGSSSPCEAPPRGSPLGGYRPGGGLNEDDVFVLQPPMRAGSA